jgi:RNA polymerase sigma factor (sigma-70 family)
MLQGPQQSKDVMLNISSDVTLAQQGDMQAYERLIVACQNLVSSIALAIVKDVDDSEEVAQQVFVSVWQNLAQLNKPESFLPWVRQSTRYAALNFIRDNKNTKRMPYDEASILLANIASSAPLHEDELSTQDNKKLVAAFVDELASEDREVVLLYYREEQSTKQVAQLLHLTEANVRKKLSRSRAQLKEKLLKVASHAVYSTAPVLGFSTLVSSLLVPSGPAAAAVITGTTGNAANSSFAVKLLTVLGGAVIGAFMAVLAVLWSSKIAISTLKNQNHKQIMTRYRNETIAWIVLWSIIITAGYELTSGWQGPVFTYLGFAIGLFILMLRSMNFLHTHSSGKHDTNDCGDIKKVKKPIRFINYLFIFLGLSAGFAGVIIGLLNRGRLIL